VNKYSKFQMDTVDSFWEMDSDKKLNRRSRWRWSDDNSSTFFLQKVELKKKVKSYIVPQLYSKVVNYISLELKALYITFKTDTIIV
jgi:hypothetical protein